MSDAPSVKLPFLSRLLAADYSDPSPELVSLEALVDGKKKDEIEFQIYGLMVDPAELETAESSEVQEQWGCKVPKTDTNFCGCTSRVRSINRGEQYIRTVKVKTPSGAEKEVENDSSYDEFLLAAMVGEHGMIKRRYRFPVEGGLVYEVDVPLAPDGTMHKWVKIDLEIPRPIQEGQEMTRADLLEFIKTVELPPLPLTLQDVRVLPPINRRKEDEEAISKLYPKYFLTKNIFLNPEEPNASQINVIAELDSFGR